MGLVGSPPGLLEVDDVLTRLEPADSERVRRFELNAESPARSRVIDRA
jgi:hypothetical protein